MSADIDAKKMINDASVRFAAETIVATTHVTDALLDLRQLGTHPSVTSAVDSELADLPLASTMTGTSASAIFGRLGAIAATAPLPTPVG